MRKVLDDERRDVTTVHLSFLGLTRKEKNVRGQ